MSDAVIVALITGLPAIIAAVQGFKAARISSENKKALEKNEVKQEEIHVLVNSRMTETNSKLDAALTEIGRLKGEEPLTIAEAPSGPPAKTFVDSA